jgi:hypothetical protein
MIQNASSSVSLLAASQEMHRVWGRFDHANPADGTSQLLIVAGIAAIVALSFLIWIRSARRPARVFISNGPAKLFRELCRAHGLGYRSRRLLKRLASARNVASPALLFVEPEHFEPSALPASFQSSAQELRQLRAQLFDE